MSATEGLSLADIVEWAGDHLADFAESTRDALNWVYHDPKALPLVAIFFGAVILFAFAVVLEVSAHTRLGQEREKERLSGAEEAAQDFNDQRINQEQEGGLGSNAGLPQRNKAFEFGKALGRMMHRLSHLRGRNN